MSRQSWIVWEWVDEAGRPVYVGVGQGEKADKDTITAHLKTRNCPLADWLVRNKRPQRSDVLPHILLHKCDALAVYYARRAAIRTAGYKLLSSRPHGTKEGGGKRRPVQAPWGEVYESVRHAARQNEVTAATICRYCQDPFSEWSYLE